MLFRSAPFPGKIRSMALNKDAAVNCTKRKRKQPFSNCFRIHGEDSILLRMTRVSLHPYMSLIYDLGNKMS